MALVAVNAVVHIPANIRVIEIRRVVASMATRALEDQVVVRIGVANRADSIRIPVIEREEGVVECRA
jgi:hypothetical protein